MVTLGMEEKFVTGRTRGLWHHGQIEVLNEKKSHDLVRLKQASLLQN